MLVKVVLNKNLMSAVARQGLGSNFARTLSTTVMTKVPKFQPPRWNYTIAAVDYGVIVPTQPMLVRPMSISPATKQFSTMYADTIPPTRALDVDVVKKIMDELRSIDSNSDERIDTDELKQLLFKHNTAFTDDEIVEIGELFYAGKTGGSVSFRRFIEALDLVLQAEQGVEKNIKNPLDIGTCGNEYLFFRSHGNYTPEELEVRQTHTEPENFRDRLAFNSVKVVRAGFDWATGWNYGNITN